jgi:hypothetical protein
LRKIFIIKIQLAKIALILLITVSITFSVQCETVEKILAKIEGRIFTQSDLEITKTFQLVEIIYGKTETPNDDLYLSNMIDSELIYKEGTLLKIIAITDKEIENELALLKESIGINFSANLKKYEITEDNLKILIKEKMLARKYLDIRKNFFMGFGEEKGNVKMQEWLIGLREKAGLKILKEVHQ